MIDSSNVESGESKAEQSNRGPYYSTDADGFLLKTVTTSLIQAKWMAPLNVIRSLYVGRLGDSLHSMYVRGSVARGTAIDGLSDLDLVVLLNSSAALPSPLWSGHLRSHILQEYPFVARVDMITEFLCNIHRLPGIRRIVKLEAVCVHGVDISDALPRLRVGPHMITESYHLQRDLSETIARLQVENRVSVIRQMCVTLMKTVVRAAFEIVMEREQRYTRDLLPCFEAFAKYYPQRKAIMFIAMRLAIEPTHDKYVLLDMASQFLTWMPRELARLYPSVDDERALSS